MTKEVQEGLCCSKHEKKLYFGCWTYRCTGGMEILMAKLLFLYFISPRLVEVEIK